MSSNRFKAYLSKPQKLKFFSFLVEGRLKGKEITGIRYISKACLEAFDFAIFSFRLLHSDVSGRRPGADDWLVEYSRGSEPRFQSTSDEHLVRYIQDRQHLWGVWEVGWLFKKLSWTYIILF